jgi:hypothetical protein
MTATTRQQLYIFDHPESKIRFLESTLHGDDWRATIVLTTAQNPAPEQQARALEANLKARGYITRLTRDAHGSVLLNLHHLSTKSEFIETMREMGLARGTAFTVEHIGELTSHALVQFAHFFSYVIKEPARLFSGIYLAGDGFMSLAEMAHKSPTPSATNTPSQVNRIQKIRQAVGTAGSIGNWAQSLIYLKWAKSGAELNFDDLRNAFDAGQKNGIEATNFKGWSDPKLSDNLFTPLTNAIKRTPIETGAWAMVASQLAFITARGIDISLERPLLKGQPSVHPREWLKLLKVNDLENAEETQKIFGRSIAKAEEVHLGAVKRTLGSSINLLRAGLSIAGWQLLTRAHPHHDTLTAWTDNPLKRLGEVIDNHTEQAVGTMTAAASLVGIAAASFSRNRWQMGGEFIWLAGDAIVFLFDKENYGQANAKLELPLIDAATKFLKAMPVALGPEAEKRMIHDLSCHLAVRTMNENQRKTKLADPVKVEEDTKNLAVAIEAGLHANITNHQSIFQKIAYESAVIAGKFGTEQMPEVANKIAEALAKTPSLNATATEWKTAIHNNLQQVIVDHKSIHTIGQLTNDIAQLVLISPAASNAGVAMAVYDAVSGFLPRDPNGVAMLGNAITAKAAQTLNITPEEITAASQCPPTPHQQAASR